MNTNTELNSSEEETIVVTPQVIEDRLQRVRESMRANQKVATEASTSSATEGKTEPAAPKEVTADGASGEKSGQRTDRPRRTGSDRSRRGDDSSDSRSRDRKSDKEGTRARERFIPVPRGPVATIAPPNLRAGLPDDLEQQLNDLFQDAPIDTLMANVDAVAGQEQYEDGTRLKARIVSILRDSVFVELGSREQGTIPIKQFPAEQPPVVGQEVEVIVTRYNSAEGLYEVSLPLAAAEVGDWSSVNEGMIVETRIIGANKGGLECEVGKLRGFLPIGQIAMFRVENPEEFVGERWKCLITEVNPQRRNLVLSRRALMEKEREEQKEKLWAELEVGQVRDGLVRKLIDAGAFVDLGGADGFIHVSAMSWGRVKHPSEVLKEGDRVKVTITKIDANSGRISLSFKDESLDPWLTVGEKFHEKDQVRGRVATIMPFGAFVEIMPGLEGLVHISEISYKRVGAVSEVLHEGDFVDVMILSIDTANRKMSLSIKQLGPDPRIEEQAKADAEEAASRDAERRKEEAEVEAVRERIRKNQPKGPLKGGVSSNSSDNHFGLHF
ncbi:MAG: S1 RNA-binding domain-containing protein [Planctomycetia bacterium]|nr:S1 RNA-binding domain-containing protein [Planctomycetia bacterium]